MITLDKYHPGSADFVKALVSSRRHRHRHKEIADLTGIDDAGLDTNRTR
jgi:hypothetical protein